MRRRDFLGGMASAAWVEALGAGPIGWADAAAAPGTVDPMTPGAYRAMRRFADLRAGRLAWVERGSGEAALFLHGFPLNSFQWRGALELLATHRRCIAPDSLGLGFTDARDGQSVAPEAQVDMLVEFLDRLGVRAVDLVASDSGGAVAQLVCRHPGRVRTLLLTNCDTEIDSPPAALRPVIDLARAGTFADAWLGRWLADRTLARSTEGIGGMCYVDPGQPTDAAIETYFTPLLSSPRRRAQLHAYALGLEHNALQGAEPLLRRWKRPVRIVWGTADDIFSPESPGYLSDVFGSSSSVRRLAGRKLFFPEELPEVIAMEARRLWTAA